MPKNHGLFQEADRPPAVRLGIKSVFDSLSRAPFVASSGRVLTTQIATYQLPPKEFEAFEFHFRHITTRLLHSLDVFQRKMATIGENFNESIDPFAHGNTSLEAGIAADSILHYLNIFIDDIAKLIPFVVSNTYPPEIFQGFGDAKGELQQGKLLASLKPVFQKLNKSTSWWYLGFKKGKGMRQRIVHYPDLVTIQGEQRLGEQLASATAYLLSQNPKVVSPNFEDLLRTILAGMCEWLDELEVVLLQRLADRAKAMGASWSPPAQPAQFFVPMEKPRDWRDIPAKDFLYLPLCDASAPLKSRVRYSLAQ
jgi:hypothetical protein